MKEYLENINLEKNEERLFQWSDRNRKPLRDGQESCWKKILAEGDRITEYDVNTLKDLQVYFENAGVERECSLIISAEALKWGTAYAQANGSAGGIGQDGMLIENRIPDFKYVF